MKNIEMLRDAKSTEQTNRIAIFSRAFLSPAPSRALSRARVICPNLVPRSLVTRDLLGTRFFLSQPAIPLPLKIPLMQGEAFLKALH